MGSESSQDRKPDLVIECPKCGCPNLPTDRLCTYCRQELSAVAVQPGFFESVARFLEYYMHYLKFRLKTPRKSSRAKQLAKTMLVILLSASLIVPGLYLLFASITGAGFIYLCLGLLLVLYGGSALNNYFRRGGSRPGGSRRGGDRGGDDNDIYH
jgi:hypothetical protein